MYTQNNRKKSKNMSGIMFLIVGMLFTVVSIMFMMVLHVTEENIPDEAQWYSGKVVDVVSCETEYKTTKSSGKTRRKTVYNCEVIIEYEAEGTVYSFEHKITESRTKVAEGDQYYIKATPENPDRVYVVSTTTNTKGMYGAMGIFVVIGVALIIVGIVVLVKNRKRNKAEASIYNM